MDKTDADQDRSLNSLYQIEEIAKIAKIDINRRSRRGIPEVIYAETKKLSEIKAIIKVMIKQREPILVSRIQDRDYTKIVAFAKQLGLKVRTGKNSSTLLLYYNTIKYGAGHVGILCAGTSDIGVAEEARLMCECMGCRCITSYDVGVAGIQRIFPELEKMIKSNIDCLIVVAGMEGALATIVSSLVDIPIIGVPTSVGYGFGQKGVASLASMLQSCALGLAVVNIDGGIAAGGIAANIANRARRK